MAYTMMIKEKTAEVDTDTIYCKSPKLSHRNISHAYNKIFVSGQCDENYLLTNIVSKCYILYTSNLYELLTSVNI